MHQSKSMDYEVKSIKFKEVQIKSPPKEVDNRQTKVADAPKSQAQLMLFNSKALLENKCNHQQQRHQHRISFHIHVSAQRISSESFTIFTDVSEW